MITSLNIVAKTFARLLATIIATRRRPVLILHLEVKYAKMDCKNEIYAKNWVKKHLDCKKSIVRKSQWSTEWKSTVKAERRSQLSDDAKMMSSNDASEWCQQLGLTWQNDIISDINKRVTYRGGAWGRMAIQLRWDVVRGGMWGAWLSMQIIVVARAGECGLRWLQNFHGWVDQRKTISMVLAEN